MTFNPFILHALYSITSQIKHPNCLPPWSQERNRDSGIFRWKISKDNEGREKSEKSPQRCPWQFILSKGNFLKWYKAREMRGKFIHVFEMKKRGPNMQNCIHVPHFLLTFSLLPWCSFLHKECIFHSSFWSGPPGEGNVSRWHPGHAKDPHFKMWHLKLTQMQFQSEISPEEWRKWRGWRYYTNAFAHLFSSFIWIFSLDKYWWQLPGWGIQLQAIIEL